MVVNGANSRLGTSFKNFLHLLHQVWPNDLLNNCVPILTNCDELSVNLDPSILRRDLSVNDNKVFHLQNSLFRWDRINHAPKTIRRFQQDFEDNLEKIAQLVKTLLQFNNVSTEAFQAGAIKILVIERCVCDSINSMIQLLTAFKDQQVAEVGIDAAQHTMQSNKEWDKQRQINAIRWVEVPCYRSPSPPQSKQKFTRDTFLKDQSTTSGSKDNQLQKSKYSDDSQEKRLSHSLSGDHSATKTDATVDNDKKRSQQSTHSEYDSGNRSSSKSTSSQKDNNYTCAYNSHSDNKQPTAVTHSSKSSESHSTTGAGGSNSTAEAGGKCDKHNLSSPSVNHNKQRALCATSSHTNSRDYFHSHSDSSNRPMYRQEQTQIQVTIPDNEARSYHDSAQRQEFALKERKQDLIYEQQILASSMMSWLDKLKKQMAQLRSINKNYDVIERNRELLLAFKEIIQVLGSNSQMQRYFDETVNILSNK